jgi:putative transposase
MLDAALLSTKEVMDTLCIETGESSTIRKTTYQYKLRLNKNQTAIFEAWLEALRWQYNNELQSALDWWQDSNQAVDSIETHFKERRKRSKINELFTLELKVPSGVAQDGLERVKRTLKRSVEPNAKGNCAGKPHFKKAQEYNSFTYPQVTGKWILKSHLKLPLIKKVNVIFDRRLPDDCEVKTVTVCRKIDQWYVNVVVQQEVPLSTSQSVHPTLENTVGIDLGVKEGNFLVTDSNKYAKCPRFFRQAEEKLAELRRKLEKHQPGTKPYKILRKRIAKCEQRVANQRKDFHHKVANAVVKEGLFIAVEALRPKKMACRCKPKVGATGEYLPNGQAAKSGLNKSIYDAGWAQFLEILTYKVERAGGRIISVNPSGTSQICSYCGETAQKEMNVEWHDCSNCGRRIDRDYNAARNIKFKAIKFKAVDTTSFNALPVPQAEKAPLLHWE